VGIGVNRIAGSDRRLGSQAGDGSIGAVLERAVARSTHRRWQFTGEHLQTILVGKHSAWKVK
jgi:hypothetical protein